MNILNCLYNLYNPNSVTFVLILQDAYKFSSEQATHFYESVSKGMEGFGLETPNAS